jgi:hypothetical protein
VNLILNGLAVVFFSVGMKMIGAFFISKKEKTWALRERLFVASN